MSDIERKYVIQRMNRREYDAAQEAISKVQAVINPLAWIEQKLLPELDKIIKRGYRKTSIKNIKQFILSHRDEWKGK